MGRSISSGSKQKKKNKKQKSSSFQNIKAALLILKISNCKYTFNNYDQKYKVKTVPLKCFLFNTESLTRIIPSATTTAIDVSEKPHKQGMIVSV